MAVDTRNKRASIIGLAIAARLVLPAPDGTIDQADRQQLAYSYAGILAQAQTVGPTSLHVTGLSSVGLTVSGLTSTGLSVADLEDV